MKLNANELKLIALITMIVDHIGVYFAPIMSYDIYSACRIIGRIAMPIFVYFIVQGFFKTSNLKKYIFRIFLLAVIADILLKIVYNIYPREDLIYLINTYNIVFNFFIILVILRMLDKKLIINNSNNSKLVIEIIDKVIRVVVIFASVILYFCIKIDYDINLLGMAICIYIFEKILSMKEYNNNSKNLIKIIMCLTLYTFCIIKKSNYCIFTIFSIPLILLYNGKRGKNTKFNKYIFYVVFALQSVVLYIISSIFIK